MPKKDLNQIAFDVVRRATGEAAPEPANVVAGRKGGLKGGVVRRDALTPARRKAIAVAAAHARWAKKRP